MAATYLSGPLSPNSKLVVYVAFLSTPAWNDGLRTIACALAQRRATADAPYPLTVGEARGQA